jgi:lysozyme
MRMTSDGLGLIKRFEGFRAEAYRDAVGVLTIGYGHTAMAGAPDVREGQTITREEGGRILDRDVDAFARGVAKCLARELAPPQFSALVSFAYNVGLGNFRKSSVLKAVNSGALDAVPRRLQLWVKAGGRVLPGLVKRRAAEAAMFAGGAEEVARTAPVEALPGKPVFESTTNIAAMVSAIAGVAVTAATSIREVAEIVNLPVAATLALIAIAGATAWIVRERWLKARDEGV